MSLVFSCAIFARFLRDYLNYERQRIDVPFESVIDLILPSRWPISKMKMRSAREASVIRKPNALTNGDLSSDADIKFA